MRVVNRKNFVKGKCIVISNHQSNNDPPILMTVFWRPLHIMAKKELFSTKLGSCFFNSLNCIPVDRSKVDLSSIKSGLRVLNRDKTLVIFPEGTRRENSFEDDIKNGTAMFALKTNAPIVPMYFVKKPRPFVFNKLIIGEPIYLSEEMLNDNSKEGVAKVSELIENTMRDMKQKYEKKPRKEKKCKTPKHKEKKENKNCK